jgi:hypothetical protein
MGFERMYGGTRKDQDRPRNENDFYPTPPFAVRALLRYEGLKFRYGDASRLWEPACGKGYLAEEMRRLDYWVKASDKFEYAPLGTGGYDFGVDFLEADPVLFEDVDAVITNPPYSKDKAEKFALKAIENGKYTAMLCRTMFLEGRKRRRRLFSKYPPSRIYQFDARFSCSEENIMTDPIGGMVAFSWFVWDPMSGTQPGQTRTIWLDTEKELEEWKASFYESAKWSIDAGKMKITGEEEWPKDARMIKIES